jgi:tRNA-2-methylthio-N6-dimethylallyladenosine synthase
MKAKRLFIQTIGCQMNVYDSEQMRNRLAASGYEETNDLSQADVIILNTCSIREKAEQKAFSFLGRLSGLKQQKPELVIAIGGCVAQQEGDRILGRMPHIDLVFGTQAISRLPQLIARIQRSGSRLVDVKMSDSITAEDYTIGQYPRSDISAFVTIMRGCDNYCTYCVVPYVRGRETSRRSEDIIEEIRCLVGQGIREVTLLGQNVNSYGKKEGLCSFDQLLKLVEAVEGLERIRFTTSHPKDLSSDLMNVFNGLNKLCRHIHLPVQSGSDSVLKRMNRNYTIEQYLDKIDVLRKTCPDIAITSDIIVGFPGETELDYKATLDLIDLVKFDGLFAFNYSDRPNAPANRFGQKIPEDIKKERLNIVLDHQRAITMAKHKAMVGTVHQVLVDGNSTSTSQRKHGVNGEEEEKFQWKGRTSANKIVHFDDVGESDSSNQSLTGRIMDIMITKALPHCLLGQPMYPLHFNKPEGKGDLNDAT